MTSTVLITAAELASALASSTPPVVLDVRWLLGGPPGHGEYLTGHIPGAVFVDLNDELASHGEPTAGRHPLPSLAALQESARRWGINPGSTVVVYDDNGNTASARAWWLLRWAGLTDVRLLDGALGAWKAAGFAIATDDLTPTAGTVALAADRLPVLPFEKVESFEGVLLDARAGERYRGEVEPVDPKAGHIPGALSAPTGENLTADGFFKPAAELKARFAAIGATPRCLRRGLLRLRGDGRPRDRRSRVGRHRRRALSRLVESVEQPRPARRDGLRPSTPRRDWKLSEHDLPDEWTEVRPQNLGRHLLDPRQLHGTWTLSSFAPSPPQSCHQPMADCPGWEARNTAKVATATSTTRCSRRVVSPGSPRRHNATAACESGEAGCGRCED